MKGLLVVAFAIAASPLARPAICPVALQARIGLAGGGFRGGTGLRAPGSFAGPGFVGRGFAGRGFHGGRGFNQFGTGFWGGLWPTYFGYDSVGNAQPENTVIVLPQPSVAAAPVAPPPPPKPEIHEYNPPANGDPGAVFSLVSNDGRAREAIAVWVQGDVVQYITPDGDGGHLPLTAVNRAATRRANAEKHLSLWLPPGNAS